MTFIKEVRPHKATIYIAGDVEKAKEVCQAFCDKKGECVTVTPTTYIYTGGAEEGMAIGFINYARFPRSCTAIDNRALSLAELLLKELEQDSVSMVSDNTSIFLSNRVEDIQ